MMLRQGARLLSGLSCLIIPFFALEVEVTLSRASDSNELRLIYDNVKNCASLGDPSCRSKLADVLIRMRLIGEKNREFGNDEIIFLLKSSIYYPYDCIDSTDNDARAFCGLYVRQSMSNLAKIYEGGLFGLPKNSQLKGCWEQEEPDIILRCEYLELNVLKFIPLGQRPASFR